MRTREEQSDVAVDDAVSVLAGKLDKVAAGADAND